MYQVAKGGTHQATKGPTAQGAPHTHECRGGKGGGSVQGLTPSTLMKGCRMRGLGGLCRASRRHSMATPARRPVRRKAVALQSDPVPALTLASGLSSGEDGSSSSCCWRATAGLRATSAVTNSHVMSCG